MAGTPGIILSKNFLSKLSSCTNFKAIEEGNPCLISDGQNQYYLYFRNISWKGNPYPDEDLRAQLPQIEQFESIKESSIPFLFIGYYEEEDVYVCWEPNVLKQKLNAKSYVSLYIKRPVLQGIPKGELRMSFVQDSYDYVVFNSSDIPLFFRLNQFLPVYNKPKVYTNRETVFPLQQINFGAPGTGKSHDINEVCAEYENYRTTFHPDTDYASFIGSYKPITEQVPRYTYMGDKAIAVKDEKGDPIIDSKITYRYVFQSFLKAYIAAWNEQENEEPKPVFLIIEEINRGNCAQIFGDIFQLLDRNAAGFSDYPIVADDDLAKELGKVLGCLNISKRDKINDLYKGGKDIVGSVLNGENLLLPNNMYIWATMNTSDQSLFPIDSAFKRRWDWKYVKIKDATMNYRIVFSNGNEYDWWQFVSEINRRIEGGEIQQEDKKLGYFFAKAKEQNGKNIITAEAFLSKVIFYLYNDVFKDFGFEEEFFKDKNGETMTFASYFDDLGNVDENRVERFIANLRLEPYVMEESAENSQTSNTKILIGNVETSLRQALYQITKQAIENNPVLTFDEIKDAASVIQRAQDLFLLSDNVEAWKSEHAKDKSSDQRYLFDKPLQAAGTSFVVLSQWGYIDKVKEPFMEYAKNLGVEIKFSE